MDFATYLVIGTIVFAGFWGVSLGIALSTAAAITAKMRG